LARGDAPQGAGPFGTPEIDGFWVMSWLRLLSETELLVFLFPPLTIGCSAASASDNQEGGNQVGIKSWRTALEDRGIAFSVNIRMMWREMKDLPVSRILTLNRFWKPLTFIRSTTTASCSRISDGLFTPGVLASFKTRSFLGCVQLLHSGEAVRTNRLCSVEPVHHRWTRRRRAAAEDRVAAK